MYRYGLAVVVCLLVTGGLAAGQTSQGPAAMAGPPSTLMPLGLIDFSPPVCLFSRVQYTPHDNDVGVSALIPAPDVYVPFGDTFHPRCEVGNFGTQTQTDFPVMCVVYDTTAGARVYGPETVYVASLDSGCVDTVEFPGWVPPAEERVYFDTMATVLPDDEDTTNNRKAGRVIVSSWGLGHLTYNDGTFELAYSWVMAGSELAERFIAPFRPLTIDKAVVWLRSFSGMDYDAEVRLYGNDGSPHGYPGTQLGAWVGKLHTDTWPREYRNEVCFDPPIVVNYDTFFVSYYQTSIDPPYPYLAADTLGPPIDVGNDWGRYAGSGGAWGPWPYDAVLDMGIDAYYEAPLLDGTPEEIAVPQGQIDSNTTFVPLVVVKNAGLCDRNDIAAEFYIVRSSDLADTIYAGTANTGPIQSGETKAVIFGDSVTPEPGYYTMTSITLLPFDARPSNDTLVGPLSVGLGIADDTIDVGHDTFFTISPNPLRRLAKVRYSLPKAGSVKLDLYNATGRGALSQTIRTGRHGAAQLALQELKAGVYFVKVKADGFSTTQKVVVER